MRPKKAGARVTLQEYISFLWDSKHPVSGTQPEAAKFLRAKFESGRRDPRMYELGHNLSVHGMFNAGRHHLCSKECRARGIRRTIEGDLR